MNMGIRSAYDGMELSLIDRLDFFATKCLYSKGS